MILYYPTKFHFNIMNSFRVTGRGHFPPPPPPLLPAPGIPPPPKKKKKKFPGWIVLIVVLVGRSIVSSKKEGHEGVK